MFVILILHQMMPGPAPAAREAIAAARAFATLTPISELEKLRLLGNYGSHSDSETGFGGGRGGSNIRRTWISSEY
jgi:hypothetical protein